MSVTGMTGTSLGATHRTSTARRAGDFLRRLLGRTDGLIGVTILLMFTVLALFPNLFVGPLQGLTTSTGEPLQAPSFQYPFDTNEMERNLLNLTVHGARISMAIAPFYSDAGGNASPFLAGRGSDPWGRGSDPRGRGSDP